MARSDRIGFKTKNWELAMITTLCRVSELDHLTFRYGKRAHCFTYTESMKACGLAQEDCMGTPRFKAIALSSKISRKNTWSFYHPSAWPQRIFFCIVLRNIPKSVVHRAGCNLKFTQRSNTSITEHAKLNGFFTNYKLGRSSTAFSFQQKITGHVQWSRSMFDPGLELHQCLYTRMWIKTAWLPCWLPRGQQAYQ